MGGVKLSKFQPGIHFNSILLRMQFIQAGKEITVLVFVFQFPERFSG